MRERLRIAIATVVLSACNFDTSFQLTTQVDPGRPGEEFREACHHAAIAACDYSKRCDPYQFEVSWPDRATCEDRSTLACQVRATHPHALYDDELIVDCAIPADFPCSSDAGFDEAVAAYRASCPRPRGDLPLGSSCSNDVACATGYCFMPGSAGPPLCGVCLPAPCEPSCEAGTVCWLAIDGSSECQPVQPEGAACTESAQCETFLCAAGTCVARAKLGQPCELAASAPDPCEGGTHCAPATELCTHFALAKAGEPCGALPSGYTLCSGGASCLQPASTCVAPVPDGALCDPSQGLECLWPAACVAGYCRFHPVSC